MITNTEEQKVEKAQKAYEQARAKYEKEKKKQSDKQRKRETHYKCMMGGMKQQKEAVLLIKAFKTEHRI